MMALRISTKAIVPLAVMMIRRRMMMMLWAATLLPNKP